jgi:hypothetical protein
MPAIENSEQVFLLFKEKFGLDGDGDMHAVGLFAFSLVEKERMEWLAHCRNTSDVEPTERQIAEWYKGKPEEYFEEIGKSAYRWFYAFSRILLADETETIKSNAIKEAVGDVGKFWPNFWAGNLVGLTSNLLFTFLVVMFVLFITSDFSFINWTKKLIGVTGH